MQRDFGNTDCYKRRDFLNTDNGHVYRTGAVQSERLRASFCREEPIPSEFAAHAASEYDDDPPKPRMTLSDRRKVGLMLFGSALVVALIAAGFALL